MRQPEISYMNMGPAARSGCARTAGAGFSFDDRGTHTLKGVPEEWQLYPVADHAQVHAA